MTRNDFVKRAVQAGLFALLTLIVFAVKDRIVTEENCSSCPQNGICRGKKECNKY